MKALFCGGRDFADEGLALFALEQLPPDSVVIHGACRGADRIVARLAAARKHLVLAYPVSNGDWRRLGKAAGPLRNIYMFETEKPDVVMALPGGDGTMHMKEYAWQHGCPVRSFARVDGVCVELEKPF